MKKIVRILFEFIFIGWTSIVFISILYALFLGGIAYLILGTPSGITVGVIAFLYGLKKGPELKRQQDQKSNQLSSVFKSEKTFKGKPVFEFEDSISNMKSENRQEEEKYDSQNKTIYHPKEHIANKQRIPIDESNYLLDRYNPVEVREGGMAKVFICKTDHFKDEDYVAVKVLTGFSSFNYETIQDWLYECYSWIMLGQHPNIVQVKLIHYGIHSPQVVMEYVENNLEDVKQYIIEDVLKIIDIGINVCDALIHANNKFPNFVHLDLKPQNILISSDYQAKVTDFGIIHSNEKTSQLENLEFNTPNFPRNKVIQKENLQSKDKIGTTFYMSPEQINRSSEIDCRSDMYSLGCIFYELLTGKNLFNALGREEYLTCHLEKPPPIIENFDNRIPAELLDLMYKCLAKRKEERFTSFAELRIGLVQIKKKYFNKQTNPVIEYPPNEEAIITVVETLIKLGDYKKARQYSKSISKKLFWKKYFPALCDSHEKKFDKALPKLKSCVEYASTDFEKIVLYKELGYVIEKTGELNEALRYFNLCAELKPDLGVLFTDIARVYKKLGNTNEVIKNYKKSLDLAYDPGVVAKYVEFLIDNKHFEDAILELQKALLMYVDDMQLHIYLAEAAIRICEEGYSNNKSIPGFEKYLPIAKNHANIALSAGSGFQIDRAKFILSLHDEIINKFPQKHKKIKTIEKSKSVATIKLDRFKLKYLNKAMERFIYLVRNNKHRELTDLIYPPMFYEIMRLTSMTIEQVKQEVVKMLFDDLKNEKESGIIIKDVKITKKINAFFKCNGKIYTSFLCLTTATKNRRNMEKLSLTIAVSEDEGNSWYFSDYNDLTYKYLCYELPQKTIDTLSDHNQFDFA